MCLSVFATGMLIVQNPNENPTMEVNVKDDNDGIIDSVTPYENKYVSSIIQMSSTIDNSDYSSVMYYSSDIVVGKIMKVDGVKVKDDSEIYNDETLSAAYPELTDQQGGMDDGSKPENPEVVNVETNEISLIDVETIWTIQVESVIQSDNEIQIGEQIQVVTAGLPTTQIEGALGIRDNEVFVIALNKKKSNDHYSFRSLNENYQVKNNRAKNNKKLSDVEAVVEFEKLKKVPKEKLKHVDIYGSLTEPESKR